jgi:hypothetical protein
VYLTYNAHRDTCKVEEEVGVRRRRDRVRIHEEERASATLNVELVSATTVTPAIKTIAPGGEKEDLGRLRAIMAIARTWTGLLKVTINSAEGGFVFGNLCCW